MPSLPNKSGVVINDAMRTAFLDQLSKSRRMFIALTAAFVLIASIGALNAFDAFGVKRTHGELGAVMDAVLFGSGLFSALLGFGKYGRIKCPGCLQGMWTTDNPRFCPRCYQPFIAGPGTQSS